MTRRPLFATGVIAYLFALLLGAPAELLRPSFQAALPELALGPLEGRPFAGRAAFARVGAIDLDTLTWRWRPLPLLGGRLAFDVELTAGPSGAQARVSKAIGDGAVSIERLDGELDLAWLGATLPALPGRARGSLRAEGVALALGSDGWPHAAEGRLLLRDGTLRSPVELQIGSATGRLAVTDGQLEVAFELTPGDDVDGTGRMRLAADGDYTLVADLRPGPGNTRRVDELLRLAGRPRPGGGVHIELHGRLD